MSTTPTLGRPESTPETDPLAPSATDCPTCDGSLASGQGLAACVDCDWTGTYE